MKNHKIREEFYNPNTNINISSIHYFTIKGKKLGVQNIMSLQIDLGRCSQEIEEQAKFEFEFEFEFEI